MKKTTILASAAVYSIFSFIYFNNINIEKNNNLIKQKTYDLNTIRQLSTKIKNKTVDTGVSPSYENFNHIISASAVKYHILEKNIKLLCKSIPDAKKKYTLQLSTSDLNQGLAYFMEIEKKSGKVIKNINIKKIFESEKKSLSIRAEFII